MNAEVLPYHWDNREKLFNDYQYLKDIYENTLKALQKQLNEIHQVDHSLRYWRILIGPWLGYFLQMVFDRWFMLREAIHNNKITSCRVLARDPMSLVANDMRDFDRLYITDDWNEMIYSQLIDLCWHDSFNILKVQPQACAETEKSNTFSARKNSLKRYTETAIQFYNNIFSKNDDYFFLTTYLPLKEDFKLQIRLGQFPKLWREETRATTKPDIQQRQWSFGSSNIKEDSFEFIARQFIRQHIPTDYLEGYNDLCAKAKSLKWPKNPKAIFTSNSYSSDDLFKVWAAEKIELGIPLVIGQHGGHFGMTPFAFHEEHQIKISDKWLSWGWSDTNRQQITPVGNFKIIHKNVRYNSKGGLLMVQMALPRYSYHLYALPISRQYIDYLDDQFTFVETLPEVIRNELTVRLFRKDFGWEQKARWNEKYPNIKLDTGNKNIKKLISQNRIYLSTYNATTFLESFAMNIPTVMFWNPNHSELRNPVKPYFTALKEVGVFHETPESAAKHITEIWNDVEKWWNSDSVTKAVKDFCEKFNRTNKNVVYMMQKEFVNLINKKVSNSYVSVKSNLTP